MNQKNILRFSVFIFCLFNIFAVQAKTVMLVLGSANLKTLENRTEVATKLYLSRPIDRIIVSGGCGAHGSAICEASIMFDGLVRNGVEPRKIYKEENAKTTVQNYVFSRLLKDEKGNRIIQAGDTVFVVSDHWHAISVAARLKKYDHVDARFFIEGAIDPKENDKLDYVSIFNGEPDNTAFITRALWLTPQVVWTEGTSQYYLMKGIVYEVNDSNTIISQRSAQDVFQLNFLANEDSNYAFIDFDSYWLIRDGDTFYKVDKKSKSLLGKQNWDDFLINFPDQWRVKGFNTGIMIGNKLLLFSNDQVLEAQFKKGKFLFVKEGLASDFISEWPFAWGDSNIAGVARAKDGKSLHLYRNREFLVLNTDLQLIEKAKQVPVNRVTNKK